MLSASSAPLELCGISDHISVGGIDYRRCSLWRWCRSPPTKPTSILTILFYGFSDTSGRKMNHLKSSSTPNDCCPLALRGARFQLIELEDDTNLIWSFQMEAWLRWPSTFWKYRLIPPPPPPPTMTDTPHPHSFLFLSTTITMNYPRRPGGGCLKPAQMVQFRPPTPPLSQCRTPGPLSGTSTDHGSIRTRTSWHVSPIKLWLMLPCTVPLVESLIHAVIILLLTYLHSLSRALRAH